MFAVVFLDQERRLRTLWRFMLFGCGFATIYVGVSIAVGLGFIAYKLSGDPDFLNRNPNQVSHDLQEATSILTVFVAPPWTALLTGLVIVCRKYLDRRSVASIGLSLPSRRESGWLIVAFLVGAAPILIATLCLWALGEFEFGGWNGSLMTAIMIPTLLLMAFDEEIAFRGYLFQNMVDIRQPFVGIVISSLSFWLMHSFNPHAWSSPWVGVNLFWAGVVLALAYQATGSLWFVSVMHFAWNFTQGIVFSIPVSGWEPPGMIAVVRTESLPEWLSGGKFGLEGSVLITGLELLTAIGFLVVLRVRGNTSTDANLAQTLNDQPIVAEVLD